jgi:uncharacterized protein YprB with RNaseH-like and TPR domain
LWSTVLLCIIINMIRNTFSILSGIGPKKEKSLWRQGIHTWDDFLARPTINGLSPDNKRMHNEAIELASEKLKQRDAAYFSTLMSQSEHWRLFKEFQGDAVCLDIETNGFAHGAGGYTTVVGLYGSDGFTAYVSGKDLNSDRVMKHMSRYKYLITFYGASFDIPFLEKSLSGFSINIPHFDLCFGARKVGIKGGLKKLEERFGIFREEDTVGMDGYAAVILWKRAQRGDKQALDLLIRYNREDTVNLMALADIIYPMIKSSTGYDDLVSSC